MRRPQAPVASQLLDGALKDMVSVACCDVGRRGTKSFLAFASASGAVCAFNVAYVLSMLCNAIACEMVKLC
jgi:hypothetical protein